MSTPARHLDLALRALAEPNRRVILALVGDRPRAVGDIAAQLPLTQQAVSQHLRTLRDAGLVTARREGTRRLYVVAPDGFSMVREFLDQFWPTQLAALRQAAETAAGSTIETATDRTADG
ncbi:MAG: ArsR/SmtB family transcription factor [Terriglobales bacterium]